MPSPEADRPHTAAPTSVPTPPRSSAQAVTVGLRVLLPWLLAALLGFGVLWLTVRNFSLELAQQDALTTAALADTELQQLRNQLAAEQLLTRSEIDRLRLAEAAADPAKLRLFSLAPTMTASAASVFAATRAVVVWNPLTQHGVLDASHFPPLAADQDYQLWVTDSQQPTPTDCGTFRTDPTTGNVHLVFKPRQPVATAARFFVSLERKGGDSKAEGSLLLLSP
jgi:hypothetical protein